MILKRTVQPDGSFINVAVHDAEDVFQEVEKIATEVAAILPLLTQILEIVSK